ncbi:hypothetical protein [Flavobacterium johnsoniae]|uniref:Uncharacterized protein n=1 Tax=Flavobacterium johnsoniae (strain ATCC 17061 / DSM 2064 / JCM 8514 / BCRC 14874 / CCUG 350202 / NBRC 14942 / NCIMB 11054 / UW101) TaxID=376686 RepID=A5FBV9_FLAJ1|nr:hypothetical protein [Flavobacterium johnsoniae]ABQ07314.1 hypothetical protein Fjoh_4306 [Flavobacterium johnsoniae UW101]OXE94970.1 hypothetical protein B0A63_26030 [Flavobacterium johnsoniae UW101]WQG80851.1 hypothetical protein SR927_22910 [Flavobacterium johnsoniae UW101]SHL16759.1 hypothetical protein SAMN05444146_3202 [Flavobacterium johnsoniae]
MIEVFKTNVQEVEESIMIIGKLLEHFPNSAINFDLEDCDKILRVNGASISNPKIIELLNSYGFHCEALL